MDKDNPLEIYETDHLPDPVAVLAAKEAVAATDPEYRHPWLTRVAIFIALILILAGTFGAIIGAINTVQLGHAQVQSNLQRKVLEAQQACLVRLVKQQQRDQEVRTQIAADDRAVLDSLVDHAFTVKDPQKILLAYKRERALNDKKRQDYGVKEVSLKTCSLENIKNGTSTPVSVPTKPAKSSAKPTSKTPTTKTAPSRSAGASSKAGGAGSVNPVVVPPNNPPEARPTTSPTRGTHSTPVAQPTTVTRTAQPSATPTPKTTPPLIQLPPIHVCVPGLIC